jgi:hypothetical protein
VKRQYILMHRVQCDRLDVWYVTVPLHFAANKSTAEYIDGVVSAFILSEFRFQLRATGPRGRERDGEQVVAVCFCQKAACHLPKGTPCMRVAL